MQIVNFRGHLTSTLWPSSISGNCDKFQEIYLGVVETLSVALGVHYLQTLCGLEQG